MTRTDAAAFNNADLRSSGQVSLLLRVHHVEALLPSEELPPTSRKGANAKNAASKIKGIKTTAANFLDSTLVPFQLIFRGSDVIKRIALKSLRAEVEAPALANSQPSEPQEEEATALANSQPSEPQEEEAPALANSQPSEPQEEAPGPANSQPEAEAVPERADR